MVTGWPAIPFDAWRVTCDTLHAHTQVLGKLAVALAPREPQLQHAALRLTARGWETRPLPAPDGSGALVVALDLHARETVVESSGRRVARVSLTPNRPVGEVTREVLRAVRDAAGDFAIDLTPQEVDWQAPLDEDEEHADVRPGSGLGLLRGRNARGARARGAACAVPRQVDAGKRLVGLVRSRGLALLRPPGPAAGGGLHHAERDGRAGDHRGLVARGRALPACRLLRVRAPGARRDLGRR